jgi:hypothetical protein
MREQVMAGVSGYGVAAIMDEALLAVGVVMVLCSL